MRSACKSLPLRHMEVKLPMKLTDACTSLRRKATMLFDVYIEIAVGVIILVVLATIFAVRPKTGPGARRR